MNSYSFIYLFRCCISIF